MGEDAGREGGGGSRTTCAETTSASFDACEAAAWACALAASNCCRKKSQLAILRLLLLHTRDATRATALVSELPCRTDSTTLSAHSELDLHDDL